MDTKTLNIPDEVRQEIDAFAAEVERLNRGEVSDDDFKRFRLQQGIYGQRQDGEQMIRTTLQLATRRALVRQKSLMLLLMLLQYRNIFCEWI
jgi:sulfite reductase beta subunit-like hemoprotein